MPYNSEIIKRATEELRRLSDQRRAEQARTRDQIYEALPEVREIDARLRRGMATLALAALNHDADPTETVAQLRRENEALQIRRADLLATYGWDADVLDEVPACPRCSDRGWIGATMCECLRKLCAEEQIRSLSSLLDLGDASFETFSLEWYSPDYDEALGMSPRENMALIEKVCRNYAVKFGKFVVHNLFLTGAPGLGKTFLSACIARVVSESGYSVVYDTASTVFSRFEDAKFGRGDDTDADVNRYLSCDLMILDDLGSEFTSPMSQTSLYTLINDRLIADRHTVISSNLSLADIRARYLPMISSRLEGEYRSLNFIGQDIRQLRKGETL